MVLGTLLLFALLVSLIHVLALGHATAALRQESLRLLADAAARELGEDRRPRVPPPFAFAVLTPSGRLVDGTAPPAGFRLREAQGRAGEHCGRWGRPCWAMRELAGRSDAARLLIYPRLPEEPGFWAPVSAAFLGSVGAWLGVSALAGLVLLGSQRRADEARRRLVAGLAHDLGTPLTSIRGFAETRLAHEARATSAEERRVWAVVYREALRMQRLIEDMLALSRLEAGRFAIVPRPFDLREILHAAAERAELAHGAGPALELPDAPALANADRDRLDQALANLVDNAYRHGAGRGVRLRLEAQSGGGAWRITVSDAGPGLSAEARAHLYEPFRSPRSGRGNGLGLGIVREIVARHGGALQLPEGPGCRVVIELPAAGPRRSP